MNVIEQSIVIEGYTDPDEVLGRIEAACRNCYKSEAMNATGDRDKRDRLIQAVRDRGHHSVLEHGNVTFRVVTNRAVTHEWVRHRIGVAYSQESTRYCNYGKSNVVFIRPHWVNATTLAYALAKDQVTEADLDVQDWIEAMEFAERKYLRLIGRGRKPEDARGVLPNDLKTELVCTMNLRAIRHFIQVRGTRAAHPQIRELAMRMLVLVHQQFPVVFNDLMEKAANGDL